MSLSNHGESKISSLLQRLATSSAILALVLLILNVYLVQQDTIFKELYVWRPAKVVIMCCQMRDNVLKYVLLVFIQMTQQKHVVDANKTAWYVQVVKCAKLGQT